MLHLLINVLNVQLARQQQIRGGVNASIGRGSKKSLARRRGRAKASLAVVEKEPLREGVEKRPQNYAVARSGRQSGGIQELKIIIRSAY